MLSAFIDDGYNREGLIAEAPRQWPAIAFTYRPLSAVEFAEQSVKWKGQDDAAWHRAIAGVLARKLVAWDVRTAAGASVEISEANLLRLLHPVLLRLWEIVSSGKPDDGTDEKNSPTG